MSDERGRLVPRDRVGVVAAERAAGAYPAHFEPVEYGRGTTLVVVLVLLALAFLFFGVIWLFPP